MRVTFLKVCPGEAEACLSAWCLVPGEEGVLCLWDWGGVLLLPPPSLGLDEGLLLLLPPAPRWPTLPNLDRAPSAAISLYSLSREEEEEEEGPRKRRGNVRGGRRGDVSPRSVCEDHSSHR